MKIDEISGVVDDYFCNKLFEAKKLGLKYGNRNCGFKSTNFNEFFPLREPPAWCIC